MELKPCPFCGKAPIVFGNGAIECLNDECAGMPCLSPTQGHNADFALSSDSIEGQILRWNTRATDPLLKEMAEALENIESVVDEDWDNGQEVGEIARSALQKYREQVGE